MDAPQNKAALLHWSQIFQGANILPVSSDELINAE